MIFRCPEYKVAKKALKWANNKSKKIKFKCLTQDIDPGAWGRGYKIAMQWLNPPTLSVAQNAQTISRLVYKLLPTHAPREPGEVIETFAENGF